MLKICGYYKMHDLAGYMVNWLSDDFLQGGFLFMPASVSYLLAGCALV